METIKLIIFNMAIEFNNFTRLFNTYFSYSYKKKSLNRAINIMKPHFLYIHNNKTRYNYQ